MSPDRRMVDDRHLVGPARSGRSAFVLERKRVEAGDP
jgi:hypothetical protein